MKLTPENSKCQKNQRTIVSREKGKSHIANNPGGKNDVRHYHLDGEIVNNTPCCDYLLVNDTKKNAYYIELKGQDIRKAVNQVIAAEQICKSELAGYNSLYRIIPGKVRAEELKCVEYTRLLGKVGNKRLKCQSVKMEEDL